MSHESDHYSQTSYSRGLKRKREDDGKDFGKNVAEHYNKIEQLSTRERYRSTIIDLRNFNNATKDYQLTKTFQYLNVFPGIKFNVLELGCGKGGDLKKYDRKNVGYYLGADIADVSIEQARGRYAKMRSNKGTTFEANFLVADLTKRNLKELIKIETGKELLFHVASAQFCIHYSYESYDQAVRFIQNAYENLEKHGIFVGTYPDGSRLHKLAQANKGIYKVGDRLEVEFKKGCLKPDLFGTEYHFRLKEVVDCPEFVIHPKVMRKLFEANGFYFIYDYSFEEFVKSEHDSIRNTYRNFNALECIDKDLVDGDPEYSHISKVKSNEDQTDVSDDIEPSRKSYYGTMSQSTWKIASIYRVFCYRKK